MKRSSSLLIGVVAATITFGSLYAIAGPRYFGRRAFYNHGYGCGMYNRNGAVWNNQRQQQYRNQSRPEPLKPDSTTNF